MKLKTRLTLIYERILWPFRYRRAVWMADWKAFYTGQPHYVIIYKRRPIAVSREQIETFIQSGIFRSGVTADDVIARCAYCSGVTTNVED